MTPAKKVVEEKVIVEEEVKKKNFLEEVIHISKAVSASLLIIGMLGAAVWNLWAEDLVKDQVKEGIAVHTKVTMPQVEQNTKDIAQLKDTQMLTYLSLKQLLSKEELENAQKEHEEIKRRQ